MHRDDVPPDEMKLFRSAPDPIDAARRGEPVVDPAIDALVHDLRSAYLPDEPRPRSAALVVFAGPGDDVSVPDATQPDHAPVVPLAVALGSRRRRAAVGVAAFAATVTGKVVLGGAVAAATLGGLHAADVVDVPLLPEVPRSPAAPTTVPDVADPVELPATGEAPPATPATPAEATPPTDQSGSAPPVAQTPAGDGTGPANPVGEPDNPGQAPATAPPTTGPPPTTGRSSDVPAEPPVGDEPPSGEVRGDVSDAHTEDPGEPAQENFATNP